MKHQAHRHSRPLFAFLALTILTVLFLALPFQGTAKSKGLSKVREGQTLYTQYSLCYEKNRHLTTNYRKGTLVPVNTKVKFLGADESTFGVTLPDGTELVIENVEAYSGEDLDGVFIRTLAEKPVNLSQFTEAEQKAIMAGEVKVGMRKAAVIVAFGYPPKHKTPNLEMNQWRYWQSRFGTILITFEDDKVTKIQD